MKFLSIVLLTLCSVLFANAQTDSKGGVKIDKNGAEIKTKKGGKADITKHGAEAKSSKGKGVEADKNGTRTTPKKK